MKTRIIARLALFIVIAVALTAPAAIAPRHQAQAVLSDTTATAGGNGIYPDAADFGAVTLSGGKFGAGVVVHTDGSAEGVVEALLSGISLVGIDTKIYVNGVATSGTVSATVTVNGTCTLDMGDGSPPSTNVPFTAVFSATGLQLTVGATVLPTLNKTDGFIVIE